MTLDNKSCLYDPNDELDPDELNWALITGAGAFRRCRIEPRIVAGYNCKTLVLGQIGSKKYLVFIRVTHRKDEVDGIGPTPLVLIDAAHDLGAEPFVVRVNMEKVGNGTGFQYWGDKELELELKSNVAEWQRLLLKGKSVSQFIQILKGTFSHLRLEVNRRHAREDEWRDFISVRMLVDDEVVECASIDIVALARSIYRNDVFWIFTCTCGVPECNGINNGVTVVHDLGLTVWKAYSIHPARVWAFDHNQYSEEIRKALREFITVYKAIAPDDGGYDVYHRQLPEIEEALFRAETIDTQEVEHD